MPEELGLIRSMAIVLAAALIGGMVARRIGLPVILGYLIGGIVIGPYGLEYVNNVEEVETLATIGVVLLMFTLGIEFSLKTVRQIGKVAILGGSAQIIVTIGLGLALGQLLGWSFTESWAFGFLIALSSTIIVLKTLVERGELGSAHGRIMIGILLIQDLSVVPMMVILTSIGEADTMLLSEVGWDVAKKFIFLVIVLVMGVWGLPWIMKVVVGGRSRELFLLAVVSLCLGAAFGADYVGLSVAVGAFLAGLIVSESDYAHQALADIRPLRDIFATLFFVSLGMLADPEFVLDNPVDVAIVVVVIMLGKFIITSFIARIFGYGVKTSLFVGSGLFQIGEFTFVLAALALELDIITDDIYSITLAAAFITILFTPFSMSLSSTLYHRVIQKDSMSKFVAKSLDPEVMYNGMPLTNHVVICGYGQVARNLGSVLERRGFSYLIIDIDPRVIEMAREKGIPCVYGDASNPEILNRAALQKAKVMVITFPDPVSARLTTSNARAINHRLDIVARVHRDEDTEILQRLGVSELVRPELEAGLEIIRHTLHRFGLTMQEIQYIVNTLRDEEIA